MSATMFKLTRYTVIIAAVVAAVGVPSSADAGFITGGGGLRAAPAASVSANPTPPAGRPPRGGNTSGTRDSLSGPAAEARSGARHGISSSSGFQWGDAGIGAAVVLVLIGVGSAAMLVIRRRVHHPLSG